MTEVYQKLKIWFRENYGHLGYDLSTLTLYGDDLICKFDILQCGRETEIKDLNLEKIMDFTARDSGLRKLLFDALFRQHGYSVGNDFTPLKQIKEFKL